MYKPNVDITFGSASEIAVLENNFVKTNTPNMLTIPDNINPCLIIESLILKFILFYLKKRNLQTQCFVE